MGGPRLSLSVLLVMVAAAGWSFAREVTDCHSSDQNPYLKFGTKTAYEFIYGRLRMEDVHMPSCEPVQLWLLARHGTRYPGRQTIRNMHTLQDLKIQIIRNHEKRKSGRLCQPDLENLRRWNLNVAMADSNMLTPQGREDMRFLGKRIRSKYPSLFQQGYSQNLFEFRHTKHERTRQSAQAFAEGLFGPDSGVWIPPGVENDTVIYPYGNCTYWIRHVEENPLTKRERDLFFRGMEMMVLNHNVSQRLGFRYDLPHETILTMYDMCRYNKAWSVNDRSPWCAAFSTEELKVLEYADDLETFYDSGYGNGLNVKLGCTAVKDMLQRFEQLEDDNIQQVYEPAGVFYFTHSKSILMMLARLGVANRGTPLRHYDFYEQAKRQWRSSDISPFAANFEAVFFKCSSGEYNRVMFFLNEKRVDFNGCKVGLCSWSYLRNRFADVLYHCNLDWCHNGAPGSTILLSSLLLFALFSVFHAIGRL